MKIFHLVALVLAGGACGRAQSAPSPVGLDSIVLQRTPCFGLCPAYRLTLGRGGVVRFQSHNPGDDTTVVQDTIDPRIIDLIAERATTIGFAKYPSQIAANRDLCPDSATDHPSIIIGLFGAESKQVEYYTGCYVASNHGRHESLVELATFAAQIDSLARSARWVRPGGKR